MEETEPLFKELRILNIYEINRLRLHIFAFKLCNSLYPKVMTETLMYVSDLHSHNTRQSANIYLPKHRTNFRIQTVHYQASVIWNSLPQKLRNAQSLNVYKRLIFGLILKNDPSVT